MICSVTKITEFEASHRLPNYLGDCSRLHGHSYKLEVTVTGNVQVQGSEEGMVMDFKRLNTIIKKCVTSKYDHTYINNVMETPTAENMLAEIARDLLEEFSGLPQTLSRLRLWETSTSYAEYIF